MVRAPGGRSGLGRFVSLNKDFPAYRELLIFLRALERKWPQPRVEKPSRRAERVALRYTTRRSGARIANSMDLDQIFYSRVRTRALLAVAASRSTDVTDISSTFGERRQSVWNAINHWQREGLVRSVVIGNRRTLELDTTFYAAAELRYFLSGLRRIGREYDVRARLSLRNPKSPRLGVSHT